MLELTPPAPPAPRTLLAIEIGGVRLALTSADRPGRPWSRPFALGAVAGLGAATLALAGASAMPQAAVPIRYTVRQVVPDRPVARLVQSQPRVAPGRARSHAKPVAPTPFGDQAAPYVVRAMATGELQEWDDDAGRHRFLTAGPARIEGGRTCRAMALLTHLADGGSHVRSAEHCVTGAVVDAPAQPSAPAGDASGGAD